MKNLNSKLRPTYARLLAGLAALMLVSFTASAQYDPAPRQLLHLGANAS